MYGRTVHSYVRPTFVSTCYRTSIHAYFHSYVYAAIRAYCNSVLGGKSEIKCQKQRNGGGGGGGWGRGGGEIRYPRVHPYIHS